MSDIHRLETNLDLKQNLNVYANCKQLDILHLVFNIFDDGVQADLSNYNVRLKAMKSDNVPLIQETQYTVVDNMVTIIAHEQLTTTSGTTKIELQFINKTTGEKKATFNLNLKVIASILEVERSISTATYTLLEELENKMDQALELTGNMDEAIEINNTLSTTITNATNSKNGLSTTITDATNSKNTLNAIITNATDSKNGLNATITNATDSKNGLNATITNATDSKNGLNTTITNATDSQNALNATITNGTDSKNGLSTIITNATNSKNALSSTVTDANNTKNTLEIDITTGNTLKTDLITNIANGNITNTNLVNSITAGNQLKTDIDAKNVIAESNIKAMESFGDVTQIQEIVSGHTAQLLDLTYQTAGGTATVITLTMQTLVNGYSKTFIASSNNSGTATTINGKPLYKPGTTTSPNLIAGKAYTVWYDSSKNCFFIKASAEGNTIVSHVLATDTFSNDNDTGLVGTMPNNGAVTQALAINGSYTIPAGYHNGSGKVTQSIPTKAATTYTPGAANQGIDAGQYLAGPQTIIGDANLVPANILNGKSIFGVTGSASGMASGSTTPGSNQIVTLPFSPRVIIAFNHGSSNYSFYFSKLDSQNIAFMLAASAIYDGAQTTTKFSNYVAWDGMYKLTFTLFASTNITEYYTWYAFA